MLRLDQYHPVMVKFALNVFARALPEGKCLRLLLIRGSPDPQLTETLKTEAVALSVRRVKLTPSKDCSNHT